MVEMLPSTKSQLKGNLSRRLAMRVVGTLLLAFACVLLALPREALALSVRQADVEVASSGNVLLGLDGTFSSAGKAAVLKRVNQIRKEACDQGVPNPDDGGASNLTSADYVPMKWSSDLERIAQTRAAEASVCQDHVRPNGGSCFDVYYPDAAIGSYGENLAWNYSGMLDGIEQWYEEKADWVAQDSGAMTGHYTSLISPSFQYIGLGTFTPAQGGWACTAGEFYSDYGTDLDESEIGVTGAYRQVIEVPESVVAGMAVSGKTKLVGSVTAGYSASITALLESVYGYQTEIALAPLDAITWTSSAPAVATVDAGGKVTSKGCGTTKLTAAAAGKSGSLTITVAPKATKIKKLVARKKAAKVTWTRQTQFSNGYEIRYSLKSSMKGAKTVKVKSAKKTSAIIRKLKPKKKYYVQIRVRGKGPDGKWYYSAWSKKKTVKAK